MQPRKGDIIRMFHQIIVERLQEPDGADGIYPMPGLAIDKDGGLIYSAIAMEGPTIARDTIVAGGGRLLAEGATEIIFGLDRTAGPDQGTTLSDLVTVFYHDGRGWRFGTLEYAFSPGQSQVKPIDWANGFWIERQRHEIAGVLGRVHIHGANRPPIILPQRTPRPADITEQQISSWTEHWDRVSAGLATRFLSKLFPTWPVDQKELHCAGSWLEQELYKRTAGRDLVDQICFAHGQRTCMNEDPWGNALKALERFAAGDVDSPGEELARKLFDEAMPYFLEMYGQPDMSLLHEFAGSMRGNQ